ncbi:MAG: PspA/IM30 family protein [Acidimicrobiales bacterium]
MFKVIKRWWKYFGAKLNSSFNEAADPKVQLEQAIAEAEGNHRVLKEQAASVIAHQKQTEMQLNRAMDDLEKINKNTRQAIMMAEEAANAGDEAKVTQYTQAAESFANRLMVLETEVEGLKTLHLSASEATDKAKEAVRQNSVNLQTKLSEKQKLLGQLDQAKMQEKVNKAMEQLNERVGVDTPSFNEIRDKIEARHAKAQGAAELADDSVEGRMAEVEAASRNVDAQSRLAEIKAQLGIDTGAAVAETVAEATEGTVAEG